jgi:hypothetical protein
MGILLLLLLAWAVFAAFPACTIESGLGTVEGGPGIDGPQIHVAPESIDFGPAGPSDVVSRSFTITNLGQGELSVASIALGATSASFTILTPPEDLSFRLSASESREIAVAFVPVQANQTLGEAIVTSNDMDAKKVPVELAGNGLVPDLVIDPNPFDMGSLPIGCTALRSLNLTNVGPEALTVESIHLCGRDFRLATSPSVPFTLAPAETSAVEVAFAPEAENRLAATLTVTSDAPDGTDVAALSGSGVYAGWVSDVWDIPEDPPVDLVFIVDQSSSMIEDQASLARNFHTFISRLSTYTANWQLIVVNRYDGCNVSGILTPETPNFESTFAEAVATGSATEWECPSTRYAATGEAGLFVAEQAIDDTDSGECNAGFIRHDALLHIIIVSDEPDQSRDGWSTIVNAVQAKKGSVANTRFSAVAGDVPGGCGGTALPGTGYAEAVAATGGEFLSICSDWGANVEDLADASVQLSEYELSRTPDPTTLEVLVNGALQSGVWSYDASSNSVVFCDRVPEAGSSVEVDYAALESCE